MSELLNMQGRYNRSKYVVTTLVITAVTYAVAIVVGIAMMAMAGKITIAEVDELVEPGVLDPNAIHTPGIFVQRIFQGVNYEKRIEQRTVRQKEFI